MKKLLLLTIIFTVFTMTAQDSKFYLGVGVGYGTAGGDFDEGYGGALAIDFFDIGYRFNESWGATLGLNSAGHPVDDIDAAIGVATFAIGPMYSFPVGNMMWDFKPQYAFSMAGVARGDDANEDFEAKGTAFIIGNSLVFVDGPGQFSADLDYVMGNFDKADAGDGFGEYDIDEDYNSLRIGVGVRYNF